MQPVTLEPIEAIALASAGILGALEFADVQPESASDADKLRADAYGVLTGSGLSPLEVIELAKRVSREATDL